MGKAHETAVKALRGGSDQFPSKPAEWLLCLLARTDTSLGHTDLDFDIYRLVENYSQICDFIVLLYDQDMTSCLEVDNLEFGSIGYPPPLTESQATYTVFCVHSCPYTGSTESMSADKPNGL